MTHSPEKLAPLQLYQPILFTVTASVNQTNDSGESTAGTKCPMLCHLNMCKAIFGMLQLLYGHVLQGLGITEFMTLIG